MRKKIAATLANITENQHMKLILDRRTPHSDLMLAIGRVFGDWSYDLYQRKPGPAYKDGVFTGTDLDLAALLSALCDRGAVVILPKYKASTPRTHVEGEHVVSAEQRHGKLTAVLSNQETFKFSVRIYDANVVTTDSVGKHRTFNITDVDGSWYDGWTDLQFIPTAKENDFMSENDLFAEQAEVAFKNFIHPNRWTSFFGQYYIMAKALEQRLSEENTYWRKAIKDMLQEGIRYKGTGKQRSRHVATTEKGTSKTVTCFEAEVDVPFHGEFARVVENEDSLETLTKLLRDRTQILERLRFLIRATEFAYDKRLRTAKDSLRADWWPGESFPTWLQGVSWEEYKKPRSKIVWQRLELSDDVALLMRLVDRKVTVK